jgi:hypothetical protein
MPPFSCALLGLICHITIIATIYEKSKNWTNKNTSILITQVRFIYAGTSNSLGSLLCIITVQRFKSWWLLYVPHLQPSAHIVYSGLCVWYGSQNKQRLFPYAALLVCDCGPGWLSRYCDSLRDGRSGDRIPLGARFSTPVQTGSEAHLAPCTMGTVSSTGVNWPGRGFDHPPPSITEVKERAELYLYSPSGPSWPVLGWSLPLPLALSDWFLKRRGTESLNMIQGNFRF